MRKSIAAVALGVALVTLALALSGCVGTLGTTEASRILTGMSPEKMGTVVGSIGLVDKGTFYQRYALLARNLDGGEKVEFRYTHDGFEVTKVDFREGSREAALIALRLPEGRYAIEGYEFIGMSLQFNQTRTPAPAPFSLPFEVKAGRTTYIGEYMVVPVLSWRFLGARGVREFVWEVGDRRERDLALARQRMPDAATGDVIAAVPDARTLGVPFFYPAGGAPPDQAAAR
jgi:hypothetical protein